MHVAGARDGGGHVDNFSSKQIKLGQNIMKRTHWMKRA